MKKIDKFIKEKLDILHDTSDLNCEPFDCTEKNPQIEKAFVAHFANIKKQEQSTKIDKTRKKKIVFGFTSGAVALVLIGVFIIIGIINNGGGDNGAFYYNDSELVSNRYNLVELQEAVDVLLPDMTETSNLVINFNRHEEKNTNVYAHIVFNTKTNENVELRIVFVENYSLKNEQLYNSLEQTGQTDLFSYNYRISEETEVAYAKFVYKDYKYYLKLNSEVPENLINIIDSFT